MDLLLNQSKGSLFLRSAFGYFFNSFWLFLLENQGLDRFLDILLQTASIFNLTHQTLRVETFIKENTFEKDQLHSFCSP